MIFTLFNLACVALTAAAFAEGLVQPAFEPDKSPLTWVIAGVFLVGLAVSWFAAWGRAQLRTVGYFSDALVMLGLIGTVWGFIVALGGVDADAAGDVSRVAGMVSQLVEGMGIALYTTLEGAVLSLWLTVNRQIANGR